MMKNGKRKIVALCITVIAIMLFAFFTVFAEEIFNKQTPDSSYWKVVKYEEIKDYREKPEAIAGYVFAGWFKDKSCAKETALTSSENTGTAYAKYVPEEILGLKAQVNSELWNDDLQDDGDKRGAIRFVTSVDSLDYAKVGFIIDIGNGPKEKASKTVYEKLYVKVGGNEAGSQTSYEFKPNELFHASSVYFKTWTVTEVPELNYLTEFTVTPFWKTLDGTIVKGTQGVKTVNQGRSWEYVVVGDTGSDSSTVENNQIGLGTYNQPYKTLNYALEQMAKYQHKEGILQDSSITTHASKTVYVKDKLTAGTDFKWSKHNLDVTITGKTEKEQEANFSTVDFSEMGKSLTMGDGATFENMTLKLPPTGKAIYANGNRLQISESAVVDTTNKPNVFGGNGAGTTVENTHVTLLAGTYNYIYGGSNGPDTTVTGDTYVYVSGNASGVRVYGGAFNGTVEGDTYVTVGGKASLDYVFGSGQNSSQKVLGTCYVTVEGEAEIAEAVQGGGTGGSTNNTYVVIKGGTMQMVCGGQGTAGVTVNNTNVYILGGTITRRVFGGSYNEVENGGDNSVNGYSSVVIGNAASVSGREAPTWNIDSSLCASSRIGSSSATEVGVMILGNGVNEDDIKIGWSDDMTFYTRNVKYTQFLVKVGNGGTVTSESGILRITPDSNSSSQCAVVKNSKNEVLFQCQGEGTYSLSGLEKPTDVEELTVEFVDSANIDGDYVLSYEDGDGNSYGTSAFSSLEAAMASVSTPNIGGAGTQKTAVITINTANVTVEETIALTNNQNVVLRNKDGVDVEIKRATQSNVFNIATGCTLTIDGNITVDGDKDNVQGPSMIENTGTFILGEEATLQNAITGGTSDKKEYQGAALYNTGKAEIKGTVTGNGAYKGGAIYTTGDILISGNITNNTSTYQAGAMYVLEGSVTLASDEQKEISGNVAGNYGGAIYILSGTLSADNYQFKGNKSSHPTDNNSARGGVFYIAGNASVDVENCVFGAEGSGNANASSYGGAIYVSGKLSVDSCTFRNNTSKTNGGAVGIHNTNENSEVVIKDSTFDSNVSTTSSGAIDVNCSSDKIQVQGCIFTNNTNASDGTISVRGSGKHVNISDLTLNGDVICLYAGKTVGISGNITGAKIQLKSTTSKVFVNGKLDADSDITITPSAYTNGSQVMAKANDEVDSRTFADATEIVAVTKDSTGEYWFVNSQGELSTAVAEINGEQVSYKGVLDAIKAGENVEVKLLRNIKVAETITIPTGANVTITNADGKNVTLTRTSTKALFSVASGSTLTLGNAEDDKNEFILDGGYDENAATLLKAPPLVSNAGKFTLESNATIQNAVTGGNSGTDSYRGGALNNATNATATISGTIRDCSAYNGGAIYNAKSASINITESANIIENIADGGNGGAIRNEGILTITGASFTGNTVAGTSTFRNGGAIYNSGTLEATNVKFEGNTAKIGGAINNHTSGTMTINGGSFVGNHANITGGLGGAIYIADQAGTVSITGVEFTQNSAIANDGAAIDARKDITLDGCNIHDNVGSETSVVYDIALRTGTLTLKGDTKTGIVHYANAGAKVSVQANFTGEAILVPNANDYTIGKRLVTVAEGAENTVDHIIVRKYDSTTGVVDDDTYCIDKAGLLQYKHAVAKIGTITYLTLADAIAAAGNESMIYVLKDIELGETIAIGSEEAAKELTITNVVGKDITITRTSQTTLFSVASGSALILGNSADDENEFIVDGGYDKDAAVPLLASSLVSNAGIFTLEANATIQNAVSEGKTGNVGGALNNATNAMATISGTIHSCSAYNGGAIYNAKSATLDITKGANVINNTADNGNGGAIRNEGNVTITEASFKDNKGVSNSYGNGGAIYNSGTVTATNVTFDGNIANGGGAIRNTATLTITGGTFKDNKGNGNGGAIYNTGTLETTGVTFEENTAKNGGAIYNENASGEMTIEGGKFTGNSTAVNSGGSGGAIHVKSSSGAVSLTGVDFTNNSSNTNLSAAIYAEKAVTLINCNIYNNESSKNSENAVYDVRVVDTTLTLGGTTRIDAVQQGSTSGKVHLLSDFTGEIAVVPNSYETGTEVVTFAEGIEDKATLVSRVFVGKVVSGKVYRSDEYYIDAEGKLQEFTGVAKVGNVSYDTLSDAVEAVTTDNATTICLLNDAEFSGTLAIGTTGENRNITIVNAVGEDITITRKETNSMFSVANGSSLVITGGVAGTITLDGDKNIKTPNLIKNEGHFTLGKRATIQNAVAEGAAGNVGGALNNAKNATATISGTICNCSAYNGGAIYNAEGGTVVITTGASLNGNTANNGNGGAIRNMGTLTITGASFTSNTVAGNSGYRNGGAIYNTGTLNATDVVFEGNSARIGGAINNNTSGKLTIVGGVFNGNSANIGDGTGGAIYVKNDAGNVSINNVEFTQNSSITNKGAAIDARNDITLIGCDIHDNVATATSTNAMFDVTIGDTALTLKGNTKTGVIYYDIAGKGNVSVQADFTGQAILVPNTYTVDAQLVTFADDITDLNSMVSRFVVGNADEYYIDTAGKLQNK